MAPRRSDIPSSSRKWLVAALVYNTVAALALLLLPTTTLVSSDGTSERLSLLATDPEAAVVLAVPVVLSVLAVLARHQWLVWTAFVVFAAGVLLSLASVGLGFAPGLVLIGVGVARSGRTRPKPLLQVPTGR